MCCQSLSRCRDEKAWLIVRFLTMQILMYAHHKVSQRVHANWIGRAHFHANEHGFFPPIYFTSIFHDVFGSWNPSIILELSETLLTQHILFQDIHYWNIDWTVSGSFFYWEHYLCCESLSFSLSLSIYSHIVLCNIASRWGCVILNYFKHFQW